MAHINIKQDRVEYFEPGFQGSVSGYTSGGLLSPPSNTNVIDKFSFSADANATDVGNLTQSRYYLAGQSSSVSGYSSGGSTPNFSNIIDKFPFSTDSDATDVGDLTQARSGLAGQSSSVSGYSSNTAIDKFPFAADSDATDVGDLSSPRNYAAGQSSTESGYSSGGFVIFPFAVVLNVIDKFPFSADSNATDVGDLTQARYISAGQSSITSGYTSGGFNSTPPTPVVYNIIDKFPFASDSNATDVGDLTQARSALAGQSSLESGYSSGGVIPSPAASDTIDKFPFAADSNSTDVGNLFQTRGYTSGQQV